MGKSNEVEESVRDIKVTIREDEELPRYIKDALIARFEGWELVELLDIDIEDIVDLFEEEILKELDFIEEELGITKEDNDD
jgi:hypothetical protein